jgi:type IV secretion system protein VirB10
MSDFEEGQKEPTDSGEGQRFLDRESILNPLDSKKKNFGVFGLILMGAAALLLIFLFNGKEKPKGGLDKEAVEFEPASKRQIVIPESPPALPLPMAPKGPSEEELARLKKEEALRQARLKSAIVVYGNRSNGPAPKSDSLSDGGGKTDSPGDGGGNSNSRFQEEAGAKVTPRAKASNLGSIDQMILQGKLIDAVLETAIQSDLPGMVRAIISHDVFAESGNRILIPRGSRLVGQYNSEVSKGQSRVFVVWTRAILPDGVEVALNSGGTDPLGRAGMSGNVNRHSFQIFGNSLLLSIIGAGAANAGVSTSDQYNSIASYRQQAAQSFQNTASQVLQDSINIPPTITVKQGTLIKVLVAQDLDFSEAFAFASKKASVILP